jgi:hypothetical protein
MNLLPFFEWCETTYLGETVRASLWQFPVIEAFHLVAFALLGGTILAVDLRLLGFAFRSQPVAMLMRSLRPWFIGALAVMVVSGVLLFLSEAVKCYYSYPFRIKITCLVLAIPFTFAVRNRVANADPARVGPFWGRSVAVVSLLLWGAVAWGGRWIGFSG